MTTRWEGAYAKDTTVSVFTEGMDIGADIVPPGKIALLLSYDEVFYLEGTKVELLVLISEMLNAVMGDEA